MSDLTDSQKIAIIYDRTERFERALFGNGQPGVIQRVTALEEADKQAARAGAKAGATTGTAATMLGGLVLLILGHFGIKVV